MHITNQCVACGSSDLRKKIGHFLPFIAHKVFDYPICHVGFGGKDMSFPIIYSNALLCRNCGFSFSQLRFNDDEMDRIYDGYRNEEYTRVREIYEPGYTHINSSILALTPNTGNRQQVMAEFLSDLVDGRNIQKVLDFGGDKGQHIPRMFSSCERYVYDISNVGVVDGVQIVNSLLDVGTFDFIMSSNVFEHLPYPAKALKELREVSGPNTILFLDVPIERPDVIDLTDEQIPAIFHEHINYFSSASLVAFVEKNGFKVLRIAQQRIDFEFMHGEQLFIAATPI